MLRKTILAAACFALPLSALAAIQESRFLPAARDGVPSRYIVVLDDRAIGSVAGDALARESVRGFAEALSRQFALRVERTWGSAVNGFVAEMKEAEARELAAHPWVRYVQQDQATPIDQLLSTPIADCNDATYPNNSRPLPSSLTNQSHGLTCADPNPQNPNGVCIDNWGIDRVDQRNLPRDAFYGWGDNGYAVHVYVIDTGITENREFTDHIGLSRVVRAPHAVNTSVPPGHADRNLTTDCISNSHGTHVAGIVAGRTFGVAKDTLVHPIRYTDCVNLTLDSFVIDAFDFVRQNSDQYGWPAVATFSSNKSSWSSNPTMVSAIANLQAAGVQLVQSAGNRNGNACTYSFGGVSDAFVVGGSDEFDGRWRRVSGDPYFQGLCGQLFDCGSNHGSCVDLWAPAAHVVSSGKKSSSSYCRLSGTSMAAPHVAGALALLLDQNPNRTPAQLRALLLANATAGVLNSNSASPNYIGAGSPNLLLYLP